MHIVFTWIQWCWKWTQARILAEKYDFSLVEMWWEFRKIISSWNKTWKKLKKIMDSGCQINSDLWKPIMEKIILKYKEKDKVIFDSFIRNSWNKEIFDSMIPNYKTIFFEISVEKAKERLFWRMYDDETWETFPAWTKINPKTWKKLVKRDDDKNKNSILKRISEFEEKTLPIVEIQKSEWKILSIDADKSIEEVFLELTKKLNLK